MFSGSVGGIGGERRASRMLDALVDKQDRHMHPVPASRPVFSIDCSATRTRGDLSDSPHARGST